MTDMTPSIVPKSDQLNSDDLIAGPMTIKITEVTIRGGQEQPVSIHFEGDNGKPYKSCKSMNRVLVAAWGPDAKVYTGRSMTLYRDPSVKWAGMEVGGIRISHLSHIDAPMTMALTATKGSRKPYTVHPLKVVAQVTFDFEKHLADWTAKLDEIADTTLLDSEWGKAANGLSDPDMRKLAKVFKARKTVLTKPTTENPA